MVMKEVVGVPWVEVPWVVDVTWLLWGVVAVVWRFWGGKTVVAGFSVQRLVWCLRLQIWQWCLDVHWVTLWWARQLKHNLCCLMVSRRLEGSVTMLQREGAWAPEQQTHFFFELGAVPWCWVWTFLAVVWKEAVGRQAVRWPMFDPDSKMRISDRIAFYNSSSFHSSAGWFLAKFFFVSGGSLLKIIGTSSNA